MRSGSRPVSVSRFWPRPCKLPFPLQHRAAWDITQPRGETRAIDFDTSEGTRMSVDLSPTGESLIFDLLGHVYRVPISGGVAKCLTADSGLAINFQPRYSPDGKKIAFVSDRSGQFNVWTMNTDGAAPRLVAAGARPPARRTGMVSRR